MRQAKPLPLRRAIETETIRLRHRGAWGLLHRSASAGDAPLLAAIRASRASIPQNRVTWRRKSSDLERAYGNSADGRIPNKSCYRNSGRSESGCDTRYQVRARIFCARLRDEPVLSDTSHRNGMLCLFGADMPCSGIDKTRARSRVATTRSDPQ